MSTKHIKSGSSLNSKPYMASVKYVMSHDIIQDFPTTFTKNVPTKDALFHTCHYIFVQSFNTQKEIPKL